jgi:hypothetical protein
MVRFAEVVQMPRRIWITLMVFYVALTFAAWEAATRGWDPTTRGIAGAAVVCLSPAYLVLVGWLSIRLSVDDRELTRRRLRTAVQRTSLGEIIGASVKAARWRGYSIVVVSLRDGSVLRLVTKKPTELVAAITPSTAPPNLNS